MEFRPAQKQLYVWIITAAIFGAVIFLGGFLTTFFAKQMFDLAPESIQAVDTFMLLYTIIVGTVFGVLIGLTYLHYKSVNYSIKRDRLVITMDFPVKKEKTILFKDVIDVEEHQNLLEKPFGLVHLVMKMKTKKTLLEKILWGFDTLPGIIIKEGIKKELITRIVKV